MFNLFRSKSPANRIRQADRSTQRLREKRSKLDPFFDEKKIKKINMSIHKNNVESKIAHAELRQPKIEIKNTVNKNSLSLNKNENGNHLHFHGHFTKKR